MVEKSNGSMIDPPPVTKMAELSKAAVQYGWVCPLCGIALAPFVRSCECNSSKKVYDPIIEKSPTFNPWKELKPGIWEWPYTMPLISGDNPKYKGPIS